MEQGAAVEGREEDTQQVRENTIRFLDFLVEQDMVATQTRGTVAVRDGATYRPPGQVERGAPWARGRYQQIDYIVVQHRWANMARRTCIDRCAQVDSDHWPVLPRLAANICTQHPKVTGRPRPEYSEATEAQVRAYNVAVGDSLRPVWGTGEWGGSMPDTDGAQTR